MSSLYSGGAPAVGAKVMTSDGEELGVVKEVADDSFQVDARLLPDYWLGIDAIADASGGVVNLAFTKAGLDEAKQDGPSPIQIDV